MICHQVNDSIKVSRMKLSWIVAVISLIILFFLANAPLLSGKAGILWDAATQFAPHYILQADFLVNSKLLLWDPFINSGSPDFIEPQFGAFSPVMLLFMSLTGPSLNGFIIYWLLTWLASGLGIILLARHFNAPPWAGFIAALGYLFSGFHTGHAEHTSFIYSIAFIPFILYRIETALNRNNRIHAAQAGALLGLSAMGGYPAFPLLTSGYIFLWSGIYFKRGKQVLVLLGIFLVIAFLVAQPVYLPFFMEGSGYSDRAEPLSLARCIGFNALHPGALVTLVSPWFAYLKLLNTDKLWIYNDLSSCSIYMGSLVLIFALYAIVVNPRNLRRWWILLVGLLFLSFSLGQTLPTRKWLYYAVPPTRFFKHASLFRFYFIFSMTILSLKGMQELQNALTNDVRKLKQRFLVLIPIATLSAIGLVLFTFKNLPPDLQFPDSVNNSSTATTYIGIWIGLAVLAVFIRWGPSGKFRKAVLAALLLICIADYRSTSEYAAHFTQTTPYYRKLWDQLMQQHVSDLNLTWYGLARQANYAYAGPGYTNENMITKIPVYMNSLPLRNSFHICLENQKRFQSILFGEKRILFTPNAVNLPLNLNSLTQILYRSDAVNAPVLAVSSEDSRDVDHYSVAFEKRCFVSLDETQPLKPLTYSLLKYSPTELSFRVDAPGNGWILVTERWANGWQATVNSAPEKVWPGEFAFRALPVEKGRNVISMKYHPKGIPLLILISWATLVLVFLVPGLHKVLPGVIAISFIFLSSCSSPGDVRYKNPQPAPCPAGLDSDFHFLPDAERPGIVLISLDTLRADGLGCYGSPEAASPVLDALSRDAILFENEMIQLPGTLPSHISIFTSLYPKQHGVYPPDRMLHKNIRTLPEIMQSAKFSTAGFTEGGYMNGDYGFRRGFDVFRDDIRHWPVILNNGIQFLTHHQDKPFFLFMHTYSIHDPYQPPDIFKQIYWNTPYIPSFQPTGLNLTAVNRGRKTVTSRDIDYFKSLYTAEIRFTDAELERFISFLKKTGLWDRTLLIITSDHGEEFLEHGKLVHEQIYNQLLHVPLIVKPPKWPYRHCVPELVESIDIMPSILRFAGLPRHPQCRGNNLFDIAASPHTLNPTYAFSEGFVVKSAALQEMDKNSYRKIMMKSSLSLSRTTRAMVKESEIQVLGAHPVLELKAYRKIRNVTVLFHGKPLRRVTIFPLFWTDTKLDLADATSGEIHTIRLIADGCTCPNRISDSRDTRCISMFIRQTPTVPLTDIELYDLNLDPGENTNLAVSESHDRFVSLDDIAKAQHDFKYVLNKQHPLSAPQRLKLSSSQTRELKALGYLN